MQIRDTELTTQMKHLKNQKKKKTARDPKGGCVQSPKDEKSIVGLSCQFVCRHHKDDDDLLQLDKCFAIKKIK